MLDVSRRHVDELVEEWGLLCHPSPFSTQSASPGCSWQPAGSPCCTLERSPRFLLLPHLPSPLLVHRYSTPHIERLVPPEPIGHQVQNGKCKGHKLKACNPCIC